MIVKVVNKYNQGQIHNYLLEEKRAFGFNEISIYVDVVEREISGDFIGSSGWLDLTESQCIELMEAVDVKEWLADYKELFAEINGL